MTRNRNTPRAFRWRAPYSNGTRSSIAHFLMGTELLAAGEAEEAGRQLRAAIPGAPRARYALGFALIKQGALDDAIEQLQAFVREQRCSSK